MIGYIVLAAGKSVRMKSSSPKIFFPLQGKFLLEYVLEQIPADKKDVFIVSNVDFEDYQCIPQLEPLGTGDAVREAIKSIPKKYTEFVIVCGDTPLLTEETLIELSKSKTPLTLAAFTINDFTKPYGRLVNEGEKIVEYKEASSKERMIPHVYAGLMKVTRKILDATLPFLKSHPEFYITDIVEMTKESRSIIWRPEEEFIGINTKEDFAVVERLMQKRFIKKLMLDGAVFLNPDTTSVYHDTYICADAIIYPNVHIGPKVTIETAAVIHPFTVLENCYIKSGAHVGPFAHIRGDVIVHEGAVIGNFVEVKKTIVGTKSKIKHLSYIGDAVIENNVNIGAGTITCNYDGFKKTKTHIKSGAFVGSNSTLIAPLTLHENSYVGAGSVIAKDVESYDLAITRPERKDIKDWVKRKQKIASEPIT